MKYSPPLTGAMTMAKSMPMINPAHARSLFAAAKSVPMIDPAHARSLFAAAERLSEIFSSPQPSRDLVEAQKHPEREELDPPKLERFVKDYCNRYKPGDKVQVKEHGRWMDREALAQAQILSAVVNHFGVKKGLRRRVRKLIPEDKKLDRKRPPRF